MRVEQPRLKPKPSIRLKNWLRSAPLWLYILIGIIIFMTIRISVDEQYRATFNTILTGLIITLRVTAIAFMFAVVVGMILGLGRISTNIVIRNLSITYIEFIRGVPILVLIFTISYAIVPPVAQAIGFRGNQISFEARAIIALVLIYSAYIAEIFRAGIESIGKGQMEAARSLGMSHVQAMQSIILPQAIRNVLPALGNDLIALLKDTSLVSVLGVREITQISRLTVSSTFRYEETYFILTLFYLTMTLLLSLLLQYIQKRFGHHG